MKNIILLILFELFVQDISCNESILSKLHQNTYKLKDFQSEVTSYNKSYFYIFEIKTFKFNRTTTALNSTMKMKITVKDKIEVVVQALKFLSNEYRFFPIHFQINLKKSVDSNALGLGAVKNCGNWTTYSFEKDVTYHACNFVFDETHFPPLMPNGRYKVVTTFMYLNEEIATSYFLCEVYTPIEYPKK